jgi:hypothetical protein
MVMAVQLSFPLRLTLTAPAYEMVPILALALLEMGETWQIRTVSHGAIWEWRYRSVRLRLSNATPEDSSSLEISTANEEDHDLVVNTVRRIVDTAGSHDVEISPFPFANANGSAPHAMTAEPTATILLIAPQSSPFRRLATILTEIAESLQTMVLYPDVVQLPGGELRRALQEATVVLGVWESSWGRAIVLQAAAQNIPALALVRERGNAADWHGAVLTYTQPEAPFRAALTAHLRVLLGVDSPAPREKVPLEPAGTRDDERRRIYRRVALNKRVPLEQRFHAAQVLSQSGDKTAAAEAFGSIVVAPYAATLADDALTMLGTLGTAGQPILWQLDAITSEPMRALEIARQLIRAGDPQTALFRLERLSQHEHESIRMSALDVLGDIGGLAAPRFELLSHSAQDPKVRLRAAQWLQAHGEAPDQVQSTLAELAQGKNIAIAEQAVTVVGGIKSVAAHDTLLQIAHKAKTGEARLSTADQLAARGDGTNARAVYLRVAQALPDIGGENFVAPDNLRLQAAARLAAENAPASAQQSGIKVMLGLNRADIARPLLLRLVKRTDPDSLEIRRWAAQQLNELGAAALDEMRSAQQFMEDDDPVIGQYLAEGLLASSQLTLDRRRAALWLANHANLPRAVEVLGDVALSQRVTGSEAVEVTNDLAAFADHWAGAARVLATIAAESPHPAARARALDLLLREYPSELPLSMLLDLAVTGSIGLADRSPVMTQLAALAQPAASRIASRLNDTEIDTDKRWQLFNLFTELPTTAALPVLIQLSAAAPQNPVRYAASHQLITRGEPQAGYTALATLATNDPDDAMRERALYDLANAFPETRPLLEIVMQETPYDNTYHLARQLLTQQTSLVARSNRFFGGITLVWQRWVAALPLGWLDRMVQRR